ncbi:DotA/TraY family protein [Burkholderia sp. R-69608]|uniref:DotA/TraY family protein n=1 Tax=Paraburkholderia nemoris TaxID=2793076 RepID=UPI0019132C02|nr:DotA/TraY family protein [Paraburkholderia nemoris]MBK5149697.1 DotA/TraY family protein [Burkholderia sp. R-69608]
MCSIDAHADTDGSSLWGQLSQLFPSSGDPVRSMVSGIFGDAGGIGLFGGQTSIGDMFLAFNSCLVIIAGAWLTWISFKATVNSAHDGEFLGKQYHSAWVPVRNAIGIISLTPLPFLHGWNLAQAAMATCMLIGIGMGNITATHSVDFIQATSKVGLAMPAVPDVTRIGAQIRAARLDLLQLQNVMTQRQRDGVSSEDASVNFAYTVGYGSDKSMYLTFGANPPINGYSAARGQIMIPQVNVVSTNDPDLVALQNTINTSVFNAAIALAQRIDARYSTLVGLDPSDPAYASRTAAVEQAVTSIVQDEQNAVHDDIKAAVDSANNNVSAASTQFLQSHGWMGIGFILPFVSQRNQEANDAATASSSTAIGTAKEQPMVTRTVCSGTEWIVCSDERVPATQQTESGSAGGGMFADFLNALGFNEMMSIMKGASDTATTVFKEGLVKYLDDKMIEALNKGGLLGSLTDAVGATGSGGTIATMSSIGIKTVKIASTISVTLGAAAVVAGLIPFVSLGASVAAIAAIAAPFVAMLFASGFAMASILPWIPFTLWLGAIASMFVVYAEALIAAPLWALAHLEDGGDGMGQQSKRGYIFTLTLIFGPAVLVIAYTFSTALFETLAAMSNSFISAGLIKMIAGSDGWFTTIILLIGAIITLFTVNISLIYACYGMPIKVVQKVFTWIGGDFGADVTPDMESAGKESMSKGHAAGEAAHKAHDGAVTGASKVGGALVNDLSRKKKDETAAGTSDAARNSIEPANT